MPCHVNTDLQTSLPSPPTSPGHWPLDIYYNILTRPTFVAPLHSIQFDIVLKIHQIAEGNRTAPDGAGQPECDLDVGPSLLPEIGSGTEYCRIHRICQFQWVL